jgi:hypothetical protein
MSEKQTNTNWLRDGLGLVLFAVFAFFGVLVVMAWAQPPLEPGQGRSPLVLGMTGFLGELPLLLGCLGLVWLGFRLFLGEVPDKLGSRGITLAALVLGLSIVLGSAWSDHGGSMGRAAAGLLTPVVAAVFGLVVIAFPLWRLWIAPRVAMDSATELAPGRVLDTDTRDGLSVAEAEALLPEEIKEPVPVPSPYPPDVRREGRIPEGARPIITDDGRTTKQDPLDAFAVPGAPQGKPEAGQRADPHLAAGGSLGQDEVAGLRPPEPVRGQAAGEPTLGGPPALAPQGETPAAGSEVAADVGESPAIPSPSWEQPEFFEEEPVDAYGTPVSLVETLRDGDPEVAEISSVPVKPEPVAEVVEVEAEVAVEQEDESETEEEESEEEEYAEEAEYEEEDGEEGEEYEEEEEEGEYAEDEGEEEDEDLEEEAEAAEETQPQPQAAAEPALEIVPHRAQKGRAKSGPGSEPTPAPSATESEDDLVFRAGALVLERERVAVSLLQREFHLDFDQATHILDRLQEGGLIGPYVGGQRRDILLTAEEWQEKRVGSS